MYFENALWEKNKLYLSVISLLISNEMKVSMEFCFLWWLQNLIGRCIDMWTDFLKQSDDVMFLFCQYFIMHLQKNKINKVYVHLPTCRKPVYWQQVLMKKIVAFIAGQGGQVRLLNRPKVPGDFQGKAFKGSMRERVVGYVISSWSFFWLIGGEVIG